MTWGSMAIKHTSHSRRLQPRAALAELTSEQLNQAVDEGGKHEEEHESRHPQVTQRGVHQHAGTLECGLELDASTKEGAEGTPKSL